MNENEKKAAEITETVLRGWFGDPAGFNDHKTTNFQRAMKAVLQLLKKE